MHLSGSNEWMNFAPFLEMTNNVSVNKLFHLAAPKKGARLEGKIQVKVKNLFINL